MLSRHERLELFPTADPKQETDALIAALIRMERRFDRLDADNTVIPAGIIAIREQLAEEAKNGQPD